MDGGRSNWDWILHGSIGVGGSLTFVRSSSPQAIIDAYGLDSSAAQMLSGTRADRALRVAICNEEFEVLNPWMRAGLVGEWAFGIDDGSVVPADDPVRVTRELSRGTQAVLFTWTPVVNCFSYCADGVEVTSFEPESAARRRGSNPNTFLREMREFGLDLTAGTPRLRNFMASRIHLLEMLTSALGIELPYEVLRGPLLTVQHGGMRSSRRVARIRFSPSGLRYLLA